ncbi:MAG: hypothetical protein A4E53_02445 [Pelotomaculum sp. PtaB.Bin104]|nr:MAG: hypothetical protein A4E53_02445 [Pelotomaculum sp. PtaB.Bin104]
MEDNQKSTVFEKPDPTIGTPEQDSVMFPGQQEHPDTCAIRCQEFIIKQFTGMDPGENSLISEAEKQGWYTPGEGTSIGDVGNLLESHGIPVNRYQDANIFNLTNELAQGHKVIIGVNSEDLQQQHTLLEKIYNALGVNGADHAVVVSGIDTSEPNDVRVIISDPGTGQAAASYPLTQFLDAWKDSDFFMVATKEPAPAWLPEMSNFDYGLGHIPSIGQLNMEEFLELTKHPDEWNILHPESEVGLDSGFGGQDDYVSPYLPDDIKSGMEFMSHDDPLHHESLFTDQHNLSNHHEPSFGGYYNADGTYHNVSDDTDTDPETGAVIRRW